MLFLGVVIGSLFFMRAPVSAAASNVSSAYFAPTPIITGSMVSLDPQHSDTVQLADTTNGLRLIGVAVTDDSLLELNPSSNKIQVATSSTANVLVSTLGGDINSGDKIGVSPIGGVGMRAAPNSYVVGLAKAPFNRDSKNAVTKTIKDTSGKEHSVALGYLSVSIATGVNSDTTKPGMNVLQRLGQSLTGRTISMTRIVLALVTTLGAMIAIITLAYGSIYGSVISIGRNPLAKNVILRTLRTVLFMVLLVVVVAGVLVYLLLR